MSAAFLEPTAANQRVHDYGNGSSASSFSEMFSSKLRLIASGAPGQSVDAKSSSWSADEPLGSMREVEAQTIGDLLPDDDDLISGVMDGFEHTQACLTMMMLMKIYSALEEQYGDIQTLHTSCKNHGFVTVLYYDIRAAQNAMRALHNKALGQMNLDVHFSIPEEKGANVDPNNGVLAISISDSSISNDDLLQILSVYGDVKEIWKASACCNKKLVEFFDVRAAEVALTDLNKGDISCQKIKVEHSFYGGARSCLTEHCSREWNQDAVTHQLKNSSPGTIAFGFTGVGSCPLHGHDYTWNTLNGGFLQRPSAPVLWSNFQHPMHMHGYSAVPPHMLNTCAHPMDHHLGSAPNNVGGFASMHTFHSRSHESVRLSGSPQQYPSDLSALGPTRGNYRETMFSPVSAGFPSPQQFFHATNGRNPMLRVSTSYDATNDRIRSRRHDGNVVQSEENKKQFELDIDRIAKGEDLRTTLMIKNIPNKYNCKLLLAVIDENHQGTYDFIYLPIDFKNKCNVGYAFINMIDPQHIIPFYKTFNGKKWEKFNSEKVASLAYARIQGRSALISHFQNSSLMNEEKWCRPILFHKDGPNAGDQVHFAILFVQHSTCVNNYDDDDPWDELFKCVTHLILRLGPSFDFAQLIGRYNMDVKLPGLSTGACIIC
ncbi:hypothetical protein PR202_ga10882 [Eleusine coracana subsp. coracana]|uniref:Mei2-like C-terminal RNA recognition motif domain-containing protein n=1 Tax=Eleusine coracana subsp. coracana TaxID=191504 RepID=A0AAV5C7P2_ELECO|nr:hypothetical protein PR202_ga10882 [Eleusine coracana subsp. coracana]